MDSFFYKLKNALDRGIKFYSRNKNGDELDVTVELKSSMISLEIEENNIRKNILHKIETLAVENAELKRKLKRYKEAQFIIDKKQEEYEIYQSSDHGKFEKRITQKRIDDPDVEEFTKKRENIKNIRLPAHIIRKITDDDLKRLNEYIEKWIKETLQ